MPLALWLVGVLFFTLGLLIMVERAIMPTVVAIAETEVSRVANQALIDTVNRNIAAFLTGRRLVETELTPAGDLLYIRTNTADLNSIQAEALMVLQETFRNLDRFSVYVPLGQTLGSKIFAPLGPRIRVLLYPYGAIGVRVKDSFEVTGINQIKYNVFLEVEGTVRVVIPFISSKTQVQTSIPLTTLLIPGKVPDTYITLPGR